MNIKRIVEYGVIIATYTVVSLLLGSFSFSMIQVRLSEVLVLLCLYHKKFIIPVTIGCLFTNIIGVFNGLNPIVTDIIFGTLATLLSCIAVYYFRNVKLFNLPLLSLFLPTVINGVIIGIELSYYFNISVLLLISYVSLGEFISVTLLGLLINKPLGNILKAYLDND